MLFCLVLFSNYNSCIGCIKKTQLISLYTLHIQHNPELPLLFTMTALTHWGLPCSNVTHPTVWNVNRTLHPTDDGWQRWCRQEHNRHLISLTHVQDQQLCQRGNQLRGGCRHWQSGFFHTSYLPWASTPTVQNHVLGLNFSHGNKDRRDPKLKLKYGQDWDGTRDPWSLTVLLCPCFLFPLWSRGNDLSGNETFQSMVRVGGMAQCLRTLLALPVDPSLSSQHPHFGLQLPVNPVPGDLTFSSWPP